LKFLTTIGLFLIAIAALYSINPFIYYIVNHRIEESFIYRLITITVLVIAGMNFAILGLLGDQFVALFNRRQNFYERSGSSLLKRIFHPGHFAMGGFVLIASGILLNAEAVREYITTGKIYVHWVYILAGAFLVLIGVELVGYGFLQKLLAMYNVNKR